MSTHNYNHLKFVKDAKTYVEEGEGNILPEAFRGQAGAFLSGEEAELYRNTVHTEGDYRKVYYGAADIHWRADSTAKKDKLGKLGIHVEKNETDSYLAP